MKFKISDMPPEPDHGEIKTDMSSYIDLEAILFSCAYMYERLKRIEEKLDLVIEMGKSGYTKEFPYD